MQKPVEVTEQDVFTAVDQVRHEYAYAMRSHAATDPVEGLCVVLDIARSDRAALIALVREHQMALGDIARKDRIIGRLSAKIDTLETVIKTAGI